MQNPLGYTPSTLPQQTTAYGSSPYPRKPPVFRRRRTNILSSVVSLILPWLVFATVFGVLSFSIHYQHAQLCWFIVGLCALLVCCCGVLALQMHRRAKMGDTVREPTWYTFLFWTLCLAWLFGTCFGYSNFWTNMNPFYDFSSLNMYPGVDPAKSRGQTLMDAGRVVFSRDSRLDLSRSSVFTNGDTYCVVPITSTSETLASYDFWAVGINCCSSSRFECEGYDNAKAHAALRMMDNSNTEYFKLAVAEAEAAYKIKAGHPLFFKWTEDPIAAVNLYQDNGFKFYLLGVLTFFALQLFMVVLASISVHKF